MLLSFPLNWVEKGMLVMKYTEDIHKAIAESDVIVITHYYSTLVMLPSGSSVCGSQESAKGSD